MLVAPAAPTRCAAPSPARRRVLQPRPPRLRCALRRRPENFAAWTLYPPESVRLCRDSLAVIADLRQYTTANIADDLEAVRKAFGWPQLNLYGTSYGTRPALVFPAPAASTAGGAGL